MDLIEFLSVGMRIFPAGFGAVFIDTAIIIGTQKRTGHGFKYVIVVFSLFLSM
jgi:hypothetical protein